MEADFVIQNSSVYPQLDPPNVSSLQEEQRSLQIALELSNLGMLAPSDDSSSSSSYDEVTKGKKSQNMTECVPVPSSEHVAEIVGRQGCKIKALRAKTNTYIKTPVRGEEPVFVVTGRKEDVAMARKEVQSAAEHFTQIRASRNRHALVNSQGAALAMESDVNVCTITLQVRVPYRVVGLVVGPKGATIKRIQQQTHTYIVTPSREKEPVFEVTGLPQNVEKAKEEIEAHIASRTGSQQTSVDDDFKNNGTEVGSPCISDLLAKSSNLMTNSLYKQGMATSSVCTTYNVHNSVLRSQAPSFFPSCNHNFTQSAEDYIYLNRQKQRINILHNTLDISTDKSVSDVAPWNSGSINNNPSNAFICQPNTIQSNNSGVASSFAGSNGCNSRLSPTLSDPDYVPVMIPCALPSQNNMQSPRSGFFNPVHPTCESLDTNVRVNDSIDSGPSNCNGILSSTIPASFTSSSAVNIESGYSSGGTTDSLTSGSPVELASSHLSMSRLVDCNIVAKSQQCVLCNENPIVAALVPCGHNLFCYSCANEIVTQSSSLCPCCHQPASMALLIKK